ncbi:hypothetical protein AD006_29345 (plasmid) [Pseudonocardia sp. EC080610-09]|uniref:cytochrome C oxidase subunit IV family protein n=1 Tax=unclassified Pseudonocardia TaxID=2619320 RepID=UPI000705C9B6|nr:MULTISPECIES: cytochrome C oxidase subunit IV family protein [unclassified Pseudonocardia]ALL79386.1 hypothetical protein AD006_29345 [Pseudonocardia sp. EC080610-09]ALL85661.1 hypothetical protein AD017_31910 [Pseudonocardia sp. EC080619-01]
MTAVLRSRPVVVWGALLLATVVSWWLGTDHGVEGPFGSRITFGLVLLVAFVKIRLVGLDFMELRTAPRLLRLAFEGWVGLFAAMTIALVIF